MWSEKAIEAARLGVRGGGWAAGESMEESMEEREEGGEDMVVVLGGRGLGDALGRANHGRAGGKRWCGADAVL